MDISACSNHALFSYSSWLNGAQDTHSPDCLLSCACISKGHRCHARVPHEISISGALRKITLIAWDFNWVYDIGQVSDLEKIPQNSCQIHNLAERHQMPRVLCAWNWNSRSLHRPNNQKKSSSMWWFPNLLNLKWFPRKTANMPHFSSVWQLATLGGAKPQTYPSLAMWLGMYTMIRPQLHYFFGLC